MRTDAFDYDLPADRIAQVPIEPRDAARLLVDGGTSRPPAHGLVRDLPELLRPDDLVVVNDTRVLRSRVALRRPAGGACEVLLLEPMEDGDGWSALVRPSRKIAPGTLLTSDRGGAAGLAVEVCDDLGEGLRRVRLAGEADDARVEGPSAKAEARAIGAIGAIGAIEAVGDVPLPPYITATLDDPERYQTVFARRPASAAAPTAGLHFTEALVARLRERRIGLARVELVVGLDTFRPISSETVEGHRMHTEQFTVPAATIEACEQARRRGGRVVAVGTTTVRALESAARSAAGAGTCGDVRGRTDLFIHGSFPFRMVDVLMTNFHQPRSSLLVMIDAFVGPRWRDLYGVALAEGYRFLSFGDAMLLTRTRRESR